MIALLALALLAGGAHAQPPGPRVVLWAWHGAHDLRGAPPSIEVAFLARTLSVEPGGRLRSAPRHAPVLADPRTPLWGVVRIEIDREARGEDLRRAQGAIVREVAIVARERGIGAIQIDLDARRSERAPYAELLARLRREALRADQRLAITALGSWCVADRWLAAAEVDLAVPMMFGPGHDAATVRAVLDGARELPEPLCRAAIGVREDARVAPRAATLFVFPTRGPWTLPRALEVLSRLR